MIILVTKRGFWLIQKRVRTIRRCILLGRDHAGTGSCSTPDPDGGASTICPFGRPVAFDELGVALEPAGDKGSTGGKTLSNRPPYEKRLRRALAQSASLSCPVLRHT